MSVALTGFQSSQQLGTSSLVAHVDTSAKAALPDDDGCTSETSEAVVQRTLWRSYWPLFRHEEVSSALPAHEDLCQTQIIAQNVGRLQVRSASNPSIWLSSTCPQLELASSFSACSQALETVLSKYTRSIQDCCRHCRFVQIILALLKPVGGTLRR